MNSKDNGIGRSRFLVQGWKLDRKVSECVKTYGDYRWQDASQFIVSYRSTGHSIVYI